MQSFMALTIDFSTEAFIAVNAWVRSVLVVCLLMLLEVLFTGKLSSTVAALHATLPFEIESALN